MGKKNIHMLTEPVEVSKTDAQEMAARNIIPQLREDLAKRTIDISNEIKTHRAQIEKLSTERATIRRMTKELTK